MASGSVAADSYGFDFVLNGALKQGGSTQVHVESFAPGAKATVRLVCPGYEAVLAEPVADKDGVVDVIVTVPADAPSGKCAIPVSGAAAAGGTKNASFSIKIGATSAGGSLPTTGSSPTSLLSLAAGMLMLGATAVLATRLRHRTNQLAA
ncbi:MAG: LPXTG cell wall anchor domain-containing protein [Ilumatobacteraceae bacterium]